MGLKMEIPAEVLITHITFVGLLPGMYCDGLEGIRPYLSLSHIPHIYTVSLQCELSEEDQNAG